MANSSKRFSSITSFISHTISLKDIQFPDKQLNNYCRQNDCSFQKIMNVYQSYYQRFRYNYDNFNEIIILLCIALKRIDIKSSLVNKKQKEETCIMLKKSLLLLQDLITSKMLLVCLASQNRQNSIYQHFIYTKGFLNLLIPPLLQFQLFTQIVDVLENCNKSIKAKNMIKINFLIQLMFILAISDNLSEESERKFRSIVMSLLQEKKQSILNLLWNSNKIKQNQLQFKQIVHLRLDVESPQIYGLQISSQGKITTSENMIFLPEDWIADSFQRKQNSSIWKSIKINTVLDIYQFLFKLQVFASSPHIEDLDSLIPDNDQFLQLFSKFLMGQDFIERESIDGNDHVKNPKKIISSSVLKSISQIKKLYDAVDKPYKHVLKKQMTKIFTENSSDQEQNGKSTTQIEINR